VVRHSAQHLSGLIDGLLDIARIEAGRFQLNRDEVRFSEFLDQIVGMFRLQAIARNIEFRFERPEILPVAVQTDEKQLRQILINLLSNAIKFTDKGFVALRVHYRGQVAEFEVEDTGIGIAPDDIERIFEPFERGRPAAGRSATGTGLGLTITRLLTKVMGGDLTIKSTVGKGTVFGLKLLLSEVINPRLAAPEHRIRGYQGEPVTILVADDETNHRNLLCDVLAPLGFTLLAAADGPTCIELAERHRPQLVLLDIAMPNMDGWKVATRLRAMTPARPAIVMLSANPEERPAHSDAPPVYDAFLMKPLIIQQLLDTLQTLLAIEWEDEAAEPEQPRTPPGTMVGMPSPHQIDDLLRLGEIGHVRGIHAKLQEIEGQEPQLHDFAEHIRDIVRTFDLKRYMTALEAMRIDGVR
jgi:CheY-like chemotaxis protein/anti-sigma regulatory factor (Ser/Thr protein kinase)